MCLNHPASVFVVCCRCCPVCWLLFLVEWLLAEVGYTHLRVTDAGQSQIGTLMCNLGFVDNAMSFASPMVVEEMNVRLNGSMPVGTAA